MRPASQLLAVLASGALHALVWFVLPRDTLEKSRPSERMVDFELRYLPATAPDVPEPPSVSPTSSTTAPVEPAASPAAIPRTPRARRMPSPTRADEVAVTPSLPTPSAPSSSAPPSLSPERDPSAPTLLPRGPLDLRPIAVARALVDVHALPTPRNDKPSAMEIEAERQREVQLASEFPELSRTSLQRGREVVENTAKDVITLAERPWKAVTEPLRRGRYQYRGKNFDAVILANGQIQYQQKQGVSLSMVQSVMADGSPGQPVPALAFHTLFAKLTGDQLAVGERERFLEATRELRDLLTERARRVHMEAADGQLEKRLRRLLAEHPERAAKHDAVFALWLECADDEIGELGRDRIERALRDLCPRESECGFRTQDLGRLNARRGARAPFNPYAEDMPSAGGAL